MWGNKSSRIRYLGSYFSHSSTPPCETLLQQKQTLSLVSEKSKLDRHEAPASPPRNQIQVRKHICPVCQRVDSAAVPSGGSREVSRLRLSAPSSRSAPGLRPPLRGAEAAAGNPKPMMSSSEGAGYRHSARKRAKPKVNTAQLAGLIVFTVTQLWWIKGFADKVCYTCNERPSVL